MLNDGKVQDMAAQDDAATTPIDLAQAFSMLNKANREAAEADVGDGGGSQAGADGGEGEELQQAAPTDDPAAPVGDDDGDDGDAGGSPDLVEAIDFNAYKQELLREVQRNADMQVRKEFEEQNIGYYSVPELTERDEQTGQVRFRNPDVQDERDPNYYFNSRAELLQFIQAWNQGVDFEFRKALNEKQRELVVQELPKVQLADFIPRWQAMDDEVRNVFDMLLEGHEILDSGGKPIGFNVDLNAVANQAEKIAGGFRSNMRQQADEPAAAEAGNSGPAMDMSTGNGKSGDEVEPKTVGEALKIIDGKNKGGK